MCPASLSVFNTSQSLATLLKPYPFQGVSDFFDNVSNSNSHALQVTANMQAQLTDRQLKSFQFGYAYTYSHALNYYDTNSTLGALTFNRPALYKRNYGNSGFDRTHVNALWTVYQLPVGPGRQFLSSGFLGRLVGGFDLNTITTYVSGTPFRSRTAGRAGNGDTAVPNIISAPALNGRFYNSTNTNPAYFINNGNYVTTGGGANGNGNVGRNTVRGPGAFNIDAALTRNIPMYREFALVLKAEAFSLTNTPQFANPTANITDGK